jgi:hypothetical protein
MSLTHKYMTTYFDAGSTIKYGGVYLSPNLPLSEMMQSFNELSLCEYNVHILH